jgi:diguanylate cyclase (GGDEF)-like protein
MCEVIVGTGRYHVAAVGYAEHDERKSIRWMAAVGLDIAFLESMQFTWADTVQGGTVTGTAVRTGKPFVARNGLTSPAYANPPLSLMRDRALQVGSSAGSSFPLRIDGTVIGALSINALDPEAFDEEEVKLLAELADDLAYGIATLRMRVQHRDSQATIARLAYYDALTDLPNRTFLLEHLEQAINSAKQQREGLALLHLDIRHFDEINKVLGYRSGVQLLRALGKRIAQSVVEEDFLARVGDSEFAFLLRHGDADYAINVAQRLVTVLQEPVEVNNLLLDSRCAIGIALYPDHATVPEDLLRRAHTAMHETVPGSGGYALYAGGQDREFAARLALMSDLRGGIMRNELQFYCQPKVDISSRRVCGAEALVRWLHPVHGMQPTMTFIKLAEQAGLITPLTHWMLDAAFKQVDTWRKNGMTWPLAVNLSAHDLFDPGLVQRVQALFSTWDITPDLIQFELTESALMSDPAGALKTLTELKSLGVQIFIDDFGTGYSSLSYLQKLPVDGIKIDQSFVMPMVQSEDSAMIVRSTIELGHNLKLKVVAEGVESQPILDFLGALGCDMAQGNLMSMPMPAERFSNWENAWSQARI